MVRDGYNCCFSFWAIFCSFFANFLPGDIIILHNFTQNYCYRLYCPWDMARDGCNCYFLFWAIFYPSNSPKNENFKKMKKIPADIIILHKYTKNHDHMLYCSWDMVHDKCNFYFSFWAIFCPLTPPPPNPTNSPKNQDLKKMENIIILQVCTKHYDLPHLKTKSTAKY